MSRELRLLTHTGALAAALAAGACIEREPPAPPQSSETRQAPSEPTRSTVDIPFLSPAADEENAPTPRQPEGASSDASVFVRHDIRLGKRSLAASIERSGRDASLADQLAGALKARLDLSVHAAKMPSITTWNRDRKLAAIMLPLKAEPLVIIRYDGEHGDSGWYDLNGYRTDEGPLVLRPLDASRITSRFGKRHHPISKRTKKHQGADYAAGEGTPVYAVANATVTAAIKDHPSAGNYLVLEHANGDRSRYMHLHRFADGVRRLSLVKQGQTIGYVGSTGASTGPHLHFELHRSRWPVDPLAVQRPAGLPLGPIGKSELRAVARQLQ